MHRTALQRRFNSTLVAETLKKFNTFSRSTFIEEV
jgi:hypothetical protein